MWMITVFIKQNVKMYEFNTEKEAREAFKEMKGNKILSEILYYDDPSLKKVSSLNDLQEKTALFCNEATGVMVM